MTAGWLVTQGVPLPLAFAAAILIGIVVGFVNGTIISYARINPLIATLATLAIVRGLSYVISGGRELVISDPAFLAFGVGTAAWHPLYRHPAGRDLPVFAWVMPRTLFGRYAYAIGSSAKAAQRAGVPVARWRIAYYVTCGALSALAGLVFVARTGNAQPSAALGIELDVITAVILGGTSLTGGRGRLWGTFIGLVLLGVVNNGLILVGVPAFWQQVVKGAILLPRRPLRRTAPASGGGSMSARIGVIGCGWWATRAHLPALQANPDAVIAGIADPDAENRARAAERFDDSRRARLRRRRRDARRRPSSMRRSSPCPMSAHAAARPRGARPRPASPPREADDHPPAGRARAWPRSPRSRGVELIIGYPWHYNRQVLAVRDAIAEGRIGTIEYVSCQFASIVRELYRGNPGALSRRPRLFGQPAGPAHLCRSGDRRRRPGPDPGDP